LSTGISDSLAVGPPCRRYASTEVNDYLFRHVNAEGADCVGFGRAPWPALDLRTGLDTLLRGHDEESPERAEGTRDC